MICHRCVAHYPNSGHLNAPQHPVKWALCGYWLRAALTSATLLEAEVGISASYRNWFQPRIPVTE